MGDLPGRQEPWGCAASIATRAPAPAQGSVGSPWWPSPLASGSCWSVGTLALSNLFKTHSPLIYLPCWEALLGMAAVSTWALWSRSPVRCPTPTALCRVAAVNKDGFHLRLAGTALWGPGRKEACQVPHSVHPGRAWERSLYWNIKSWGPQGRGPNWPLHSTLWHLHSAGLGCTRHTRA